MSDTLARLRSGDADDGAFAVPGDPTLLVCNADGDAPDATAAARLPAAAAIDVAVPNKDVPDGEAGEAATGVDTMLSVG